jgi:putative ABC transport system permease protein
MFRVALKDLLARKRRLVTTGLAIVLGIAFLSGTSLLSGSLSDSIDDLFSDVYVGIDAVVRSPNSQDTPFGQPIRDTLPASVVDDVSAVDDVEVAEGFVESTGPQLIGPDDKVFGSGFGPPTIVYNWVDDDQLRTGRLVEGRGPEADDEMALDFDSADGIEAGIGDTVTVANQQEGTEEFTLVGILGLGEDGDKSSGARPMFFTTATAMRLVDQDGEFNFVAARAVDGVDQEELTDSIAAALPSQQVLTGQAFTDESAGIVAEFVDLLGIFVSVFGYIALFVAIFIIYNTFSIVVTQRTRETALLRAIGARRRQVLAATMLEALVVGVLAALLGLALGVLLAVLLIQAVGSVFTVASGVPPLTVGAVITALVVGVVVTVLSALIPALRSSKVPPIAALSETSIDRSDLSLARKVWGSVLAAVGVVLIAIGLADPDWLGDINALLPVGAGAVAVLISVAAILGPLIAAPVSRLLGRVVSFRGSVPTRLASENAARNPKRTAATAAALTVGVTLVVVIAVVASSIKETAANSIGTSAKADYVVATGSVTSLGAIPADLVGQVRSLDDVEAASPVRFGPLTLLDEFALEEAAATTTTVPEGVSGVTDSAPEGENTVVLGIDPDTWFDVVDSGELEGSPDELTEGTMAVNRKFAEDRGWQLGDRIPAYFAATGEQELEVALIYESFLPQASEIYLPMATFEPNMVPIFNTDAQIYVTASDGASLSELREQLEGLVGDNPTVVVQDLEEFTAAQTGPIDVFLAIVYGLLALAIIIALIGIANTLSLSVLERTRELGLLRAVGMSRRQLRRMVRTEAAIIAVFGTLIGLAIGLAFSFALSVALSSEFPDLFQLYVPIGQLVIITVVAALAGVLAAWLPARRAAKLDVLDAISSV